jgi:TonB family protein
LITHPAMKPAARLGLALAVLLAAGCATQPPLDPNKKSYFVDVEFTVAEDGKTTDAKVIRTDAPKQLQKEALEEVRRYRAEPSARATKGRRTIEFAVEANP